MNAPCKDCEKRTVGCHAHCPDHKAFQATRHEEYAKRAAENGSSGYSADKESKIRRSMLKKAKRPGY